MPTFLWKLKSRIETFTHTSKLFHNLLQKTLDELANKEIFFVEIGANDGVNCDPIYRYVVKYNWAGVYVEPQRAVFDKLVENFSGKKNIYFENIAITENAEKVTLFVPKDAFYSTMASLKRDVSSLVEFELEKQEVDAKPFGYLASKYDLANKKHLFLLIDVEGHEKEIIYSIDFSTVKPAYILFEHRLMAYDAHRALNIFLTGNGYKIYIDKYDTLACR